MQNRCQYGIILGMNEYINTGIRLQPDDKIAIEAIKRKYGIISNNGAIRFALREILRSIEEEKTKQPPRKKMSEA